MTKKASDSEALSGCLPSWMIKGGRWVGGKRNRERKEKKQREDSKSSPKIDDGRSWPGSAGIETPGALLLLRQEALEVPGSALPFPSGRKACLSLPSWSVRSFVPHPPLPLVFIAQGCHAEGLGGPSRVMRPLLAKPGGPHLGRGCRLLDIRLPRGWDGAEPRARGRAGGLALTRGAGMVPTQSPSTKRPPSHETRLTVDFT